MGEGFDTAQALRGALGDGVPLRFVKEFAAAFARPISQGDGVDETELREAEERIGARIPAALRESYLLFGRRADLTRNQDPLLPPTALRLAAGGTMLVFRTESQACASWAVRLDADDRDDPPVLVKDDEGRWSAVLDRASLAMVELVLSETALGGEQGSLLNMCHVPTDEIFKVLAGYTRLELPDYPNPAWADYMPVRWYSAPGRLLRLDSVMDSTSWLIARGQRKQDLEAMAREIPGRWTSGGANS